jgi:hypothetical protein
MKKKQLLKLRDINCDKSSELAEEIVNWLGMTDPTVTPYELPRGWTLNDDAYEHIRGLIFDKYKDFHTPTE